MFNASISVVNLIFMSREKQSSTKSISCISRLLLKLDIILLSVIHCCLGGSSEVFLQILVA